MDIVKLPTNYYALRKLTLFGYRYADRKSLESNKEIYWWAIEDEKAWYGYAMLPELETAIDNYNPKLVKQMAKEKKLKAKDVVIKKGVKFGCKTKTKTL